MEEEENLFNKSTTFRSLLKELVPNNHCESNQPRSFLLSRRLSKVIVVRTQYVQIGVL